MNTQQQPLDRKMWGICLIVAPLLFALSTFFWQKGEYGIIGGPILVLSTVFWIPAFMGLFTLVKSKMPRYAAVGLVMAIYGCIGGSNFGLEGLFNTVYGISNQKSFHTYNLYPLSFNLTLFWPGPLFPLSLLVLGINLIRCKSVEWWIGLLILSAIVFPLSRIPRIVFIAHLADGLLLIPMLYIGWHFLHKEHNLESQQVESH